MTNPVQFAACLLTIILSFHVVLNSAEDGEDGKKEEGSNPQLGRLFKAICKSIDSEGTAERDAQCTECFKTSLPEGSRKDQGESRPDFKKAQQCVESYLTGKMAECKKYLPNGEEAVDKKSETIVIFAFRTCALLNRVNAKVEKCMELAPPQDFVKCMYPHLIGRGKMMITPTPEDS